MVNNITLSCFLKTENLIVIITTMRNQNTYQTNDGQP